MDRLQVALGPSNDEEEPVGVDRVAGRVTDVTGRPLSRIAVLPSDLSSVLTRTDADGRFEVACGRDLVLAAYAPAPRDGVVRERSPGAADVAWRRLRGRCGQRFDISLPAGGVVEGTGRAGADVRLERVRASSTDVPVEGPVFATRVAADGRWRVEGLDTGRYRVAGTEVFVDVREGGTTLLAP